MCNKEYISLCSLHASGVIIAIINDVKMYN